MTTEQRLKEAEARIVALEAELRALYRQLDAILEERIQYAYLPHSVDA